MNKEGNKDKTAFRRTKRWIDFSKRLREESGGICSCCGTKSKTLQVHHMKPNEYDNLNPELFAVLCRACHQEVERLSRIKPCNWIKYNPDWVAFYSKFIIIEGKDK